MLTGKCLFSSHLPTHRPSLTLTSTHSKMRFTSFAIVAFFAAAASAASIAERKSYDFPRKLLSRRIYVAAHADLFSRQAALSLA